VVLHACASQRASTREWTIRWPDR